MQEVKVFSFLTDATDDTFQTGVDRLQEFLKKHPDIQITELVQSSTPMLGGRIATTLTVFYKKNTRS